MLQDEIKPKEDRIEVISTLRHQVVPSLSGYETADPRHGAGADEECEGPGGEPGHHRGHKVKAGFQQF